jgi:hypothetical protein
VEFDIRYPRMGEQVEDGGVATDQAAVGIVAQRDIGGFASVGNDYRSLVGGALGAVDVPVELAAGDGGERSGRPREGRRPVSFRHGLYQRGVRLPGLSGQAS